ncbi:MAG: hypothetical protein ACLFSB_04100, partial [Chitinispirillaceae bacterium]
SRTKKVTNMTRTSALINSMPYSDPAQTSYIPVKGEVSDREAWSAPSAQIRMSYPPVWLALHADILVSGNHKEIVAVDAKKGSALWNEPIRNHFTLMCNEHGVLVNRYTQWRSYDSSTKVSLDAATPGNSYITYYHSDEEVNWYGYYTTKIPVPRGKILNYWFQFNRHLPGREMFEWYYRVDGKALGSLCNREKTRFYIVMPERIHHFPVTADNEDQVKKFDIPSIESFALDHKESLTLVVHEDGMPFLKQFTDEGEELWKVQLLGTSQSKQPPASSPQGTIYYGERNSILAVENGEEKWRLPLAEDPSYFYITVLSDNSLLVASGNRLLSISEEGKIINTVVVPFTMTCRPIMGYDGEVYVGGSEGIQCLK